MGLLRAGGGPFVGYPWGWPGYSARAGRTGPTACRLYGPPVPVYGPIPGIMGNSDLVKQWHDVPSLGIGYGWFGVYAASPRPRPLTVNVWPVIEERGPSPRRDSTGRRRRPCLERGRCSSFR